MKTVNRLRALFALLVLFTLSSSVSADNYDTLIQRTNSLLSKFQTELAAAIAADPTLADLAHFGAALPALQATENQILADLGTRMSAGQRSAMNNAIAGTGMIEMADSTLAGTDVAIVGRVIIKINNLLKRITDKYKTITSWLGFDIGTFIETKNDVIKNIVEVKEKKK